MKTAKNESSTTDLPATLWHALELAEGEDQHGLIFHDGQQERRSSWQQLARAARVTAAQLMAADVTPGSRVAIVCGDPEEFVRGFLGVIACRALPVAIAPASPIAGAHAQAERVSSTLASCEATHVLAGRGAFGARGPRELESALGAGIRVVELDALQEAGAMRGELIAARPDDVCLLQLTSGSTRAARAIAVTHGNLVANVRVTHALLGSRGQSEVGVCWLPLWHDMGLIASVITPLLARNTHVIVPAHKFAGNPRLWLELIHTYRATVSATTNFGLHLALKRLPRTANLDLSSLRAVLIGAEPINPLVLAAFEQRFAPHGLSAAALCPAYGLAEATLAVAVSASDRRPATLRAARVALEQARRFDLAHDDQDAIELVSCGTPVPEHEVRIIDQAGRELPDDAIGEVAVAGPSVTPGHFVARAVEPHALRAGRFATGDLGFVHQGELFVCGRSKDLIIIAGRNLSPQLIEWQVSGLGARENAVVAFSVPGHATERLVIVAECEDPRAVSDLAARLRTSVARAFGINVDDAVIVRPWSLPKTTSGKVQRARIRELYVRGELPRIADRSVGDGETS